jgi:hypothetical protein
VAATAGSAAFVAADQEPGGAGRLEDMRERTPSAPTATPAAAPPPDPVLALRWRRPEPPQSVAACASCGVAIADRFGWCGGCRLAVCFACGRRHFCRPSCQVNGCIAGLCVREVRDGALSDRWGLPPDDPAGDGSS